MPRVQIKHITAEARICAFAVAAFHLACSQLVASFPVYFGTYTRGQSGSEGIYTALFNEQTGKLDTPKLVSKIGNPSFLAIHPERRLLFAVLEEREFNGEPGGAVASFEIGGDAGALKLLGIRPSGGANPCHLSLDSTGKFLLVANYAGGSIATFRIEKDGSLSEPLHVARHEGRSIHPKRQQAPHAHSIHAGPIPDVLFAADLGIDRILRYRLDDGGGLTLVGTTALPPGSGPRQLSLHPSGSYCYSLNELANTITAFSVDSASAELTPLQTVSTLPAGYQEMSSAAAIAVHPSGRFLFASNRGHDSIAVFKIGSSGGAVEQAELFKIRGETPRHFSLSPNGRFLLVAGQKSNTVEVFGVDAETGALQPTDHSIEVPSPVCVVFAPSSSMPFKSGH